MQHVYNKYFIGSMHKKLYYLISIFMQWTKIGTGKVGFFRENSWPFTKFHKSFVLEIEMEIRRIPPKTILVYHVLQERGKGVNLIQGMYCLSKPSRASFIMLLFLLFMSNYIMRKSIWSIGIKLRKNFVLAI